MEQRRYPFLERLGFEVTSETTGGYLPNDYIVILESPHFCLRYRLERFLASIDIAGVTEKNSWTDLTLVKTLLNNESISLQKADIPALENFIQTDFERIKDAFNAANFPETKSKLQELKMARARLMFPKLKDRL